MTRGLFFEAGGPCCWNRLIVASSGAIPVVVDESRLVDSDCTIYTALTSSVLSCSSLWRIVAYLIQAHLFHLAQQLPA